LLLIVSFCGRISVSLVEGEITLIETLAQLYPKLYAIAGVVAIPALAISLFNLIYPFWKNRMNVDMALVDYQFFGAIDVKQFFVLVENKAAVPTSINSILVSYGGDSCTCELHQKVIMEQGDRPTVATAKFPLNLGPYESRYLFLEFVDCPKIPRAEGTMIDFSLCTNRGRKDRHLPLPAKGRHFSPRKLSSLQTY